MHYKIEFAALSNIGKCRKSNQDNLICNKFYINEHNKTDNIYVYGQSDTLNGVVFGVFDGMGGHSYGEQAALIAAKNASELKVGINAISSLERYCSKTNAQICEYSKHKGVHSSGTTAAMLVFSWNSITLCNIGDSKIFRISEKNIEQISKDHIIKTKSRAKPPLSQNLGIPEEYFKINPYFARGKYSDDDIYVICSDGLTDMVSNDEILSAASENPPQEAADILLEKALLAGGKDNISLVICKIKQKSLIKSITEDIKYGRSFMEGKMA